MKQTVLLVMTSTGLVICADRDKKQNFFFVRDTELKPLKRKFHILCLTLTRVPLIQVACRVPYNSQCIRPPLNDSCCSVTWHHWLKLVLTFKAFWSREPSITFGEAYKVSESAKMRLILQWQSKRFFVNVNRDRRKIRTVFLKLTKWINEIFFVIFVTDSC